MYVFCDIENDWIYLVDVIDYQCPDCPHYETCREFNIEEFKKLEKEIENGIL